MKTILDDLKNLTQGVGHIVQQFAGNTLGFNWEVKSANTGDANASTSPRYNNGVTTTFSSSKFSNATDLSIARTMLHEAVHAYVVTISGTVISGVEREELLGENWTKIFDYPQGHPFIATDYVDDIATALREYGQSLGYSLSNQFYNDLAWGGLTHYDPNNDKNYVETPWFKNTFPNQSDRNRVKKTIETEQGLRNRINQKGDDGGC